MQNEIRRDGPGDGGSFAHPVRSSPTGPALDFRLRQCLSLDKGLPAAKDKRFAAAMTPPPPGVRLIFEKRELRTNKRPRRASNIALKPGSLYQAQEPAMRRFPSLLFVVLILS